MQYLIDENCINKIFQGVKLHKTICFKFFFGNEEEHFSLKIKQQNNMIRDHRQKIFKFLNSIWPLRGREG